jgi:hypothetical protein
MDHDVNGMHVFCKKRVLRVASRWTGRAGSVNFDDERLVEREGSVPAHGSC